MTELVRFYSVLKISPSRYSGSAQDATWKNHNWIESLSFACVVGL